MSTPCPHPCDFHLARVLDRGWGEMAFEYRWNTSSGQTARPDADLPDLEHCFLYERTTYADNAGTYQDNYFVPPEPPFVGWRFRNPTDGRTAPVALGCFAASQGWAWDRHKLGGRFSLPEHTDANTVFTIVAVQQYRFHCERCGADARVAGTASGPHTITRTFAPLPTEEINHANFAITGQLHASRWRYTLAKHDHHAWLDLDAQGHYCDDSKHLGFSPWQI